MSPDVVPMPTLADRILSFAEYARRRHPIPYCVDLEKDGSRLFVFGGRHSSDPAEPMFDTIESMFQAVQPAYVLHEGTTPHLEAEREIAIRRHGEAGLVRFLAAKAGIGISSMDIPLREEASILQQKIGPRNALVYLVVRQLASFNRKTARMDFDGYFRDFFELIAPGLGLEKIEWPMIHEEHERALGYALEPRQVTARETDPMGTQLPTQKIARLSNRLRDAHMLACLLSKRREHGRVFATVGVSHVVMLEPALRASAVVDEPTPPIES